MHYITSPDEGLELFKVLGSDIRIQIINLLLKKKRMSMNEIASELKITNGALTSHIKKLEAVGVIRISSESEGHGNLKLCSLRMDKILIDFAPPEAIQNVYNTDIKIGHYTDYKVYPTCGIAKASPSSVRSTTRGISPIRTATTQTSSGLPRATSSTTSRTSSPRVRRSPRS